MIATRRPAPGLDEAQRPLHVPDVLAPSERRIHDDSLVAALYRHAEEVGVRDLPGIPAGADVLGASGVEFDAVHDGPASGDGFGDGAAPRRGFQHLAPRCEFGQIQEAFDRGLRRRVEPPVDIGDHLARGKQSRYGVGGVDGEDVGLLVAVPDAAHRVKGEVDALVQLAFELAVQAERRAVDRGRAEYGKNVGIYLHGRVS
ncbi:hypothetical protein [Streptomyces lydicus]|uniref:hypothetical protein n=1 Tax=Streptomyces lydicus TaxID=47763 RepID=UPI0037BD6740